MSSIPITRTYQIKPEVQINLCNKTSQYLDANSHLLNPDFTCKRCGIDSALHLSEKPICGKNQSQLNSSDTGFCLDCFDDGMVCKVIHHPDAPIVSRSQPSSPGSVSSEYPEGSRDDLKRKLSVILLDKIEKNKKTIIPLSDLRWNEMSSKLKFQKLIGTTFPYTILSWKSIDENGNENEEENRADFQLLKSFLAKTSKCFDLSDSYTEADKLYYIFPIILIVCQSFGNNVYKINAEREVKGTILKLNGRFELVISIGGVRICIVEAKKHQIDQGKAQCFAGMIALTEVDNICSKPVYGIVTDYNTWVFSKSTQENHCYYSKQLSMQDDNTPTDDSLHSVLNHLYSLLFDAKEHHS